MLILRHQNEEQNLNIKRANRFSENVAKFVYLGTSITNRNSIHEEIKSRLNSDLACYHSGEDRFSSLLLSKSVKMVWVKNVF
jgi:hypothetical protein